MTPPPTPAFAAHLRRAEAHLRASGPAFAGLIGHVGPCTFAPDPDVFAVTVRAVIAQLISTAAAKSITLRLHAALADDVTPGRLRALPADDLRACGISGFKAKTLYGLADHFLTTPDFAARLAAADDAGVKALLVPLYGVGPWTADMVTMFGLGRPDVLPVGDLGLRAGVRDLFGLGGLPAAAELTRLAEPWRPYRAVATWFVWRGRGWVPQSGADGPPAGPATRAGVQSPADGDPIPGPEQAAGHALGLGRGLPEDGPRPATDPGRPGRPAGRRPGRPGRRGGGPV